MSTLNKEEIIRRLLAGETQSSLARENKVSRQAINTLWKHYQEVGDTAITQKRGRPKTRTLSKGEKEKLKQLVQDHTPTDWGIKEEQWSGSSIRKVAVKKLEVHISKTESLRLLHLWGLSTIKRSISGNSPLDDLVPLDPLPENDDDDDDIEVPDIATMQKLNAETRAAIKKRGPRPGKHSKGRASNRTAKKKRKKR